MGESAIDFLVGIFVGVVITLIMWMIIVYSGNVRNIKQCESVGITEIGKTIIKCSIAEGK